MIKLNFSIKIKASAETVWNVLWSDAGYRDWTGIFAQGSYAISDWKEGSKIQFLAGDGGGMYSTIARSIPNEFMSFKHIGEMRGGIEQPIDEKTKKWTGALENYTLKETDGATELTVDMDITEAEVDTFNKIFPQALEKVKELSENQPAQSEF